MEALGKFVAWIVFGFACGICQAWVLCKLWIWFIVPQFHLSPLSLKMAYALTMVAHLIRPVASPEYKDESTTAQIGRMLGTCVFVPLVMLLIGWFLK